MTFKDFVSQFEQRIEEVHFNAPFMAEQNPRTHLPLYAGDKSYFIPQKDFAKITIKIGKNLFRILSAYADSRKGLVFYVESPGGDIFAACQELSYSPIGFANVFSLPEQNELLAASLAGK